MSSTEIEVIHAPTEIEPYAVIVKPFGLPSAPLYEGDPSAYTQAAQLYPELNSVCGVKEVEHGLLHRIDTPTQGLLLIAARQDFYEYMQQVQKGGLFVKTYKALCDIILDALEDSPEPPLSATEILGQVKENCEKACMGLEIKSNSDRSEKRVLKCGRSHKNQESMPCRRLESVNTQQDCQT